MVKAPSVKRMVIAAICIALCYVLPIAFHSFGIGTVFSPMHIPVLLCGLLCGSGYGLICGILGPVLSCVLSGMPSAPMLLYFIPELAVYGLVSGWILQLVHTKKAIADLYIALGTAMLAGRVVGGIAKGLFFLGSGQALPVSAIAVSYFVSTFPGIVCHLIVIPILVTTLMKTKLIPNRY